MRKEEENKDKTPTFINPGNRRELERVDMGIWKKEGKWDNTLVFGLNQI